MFERGDIPYCNVPLADSGYDCKGKEIAIFKPIRRLLQIPGKNRPPPYNGIIR